MAEHCQAEPISTVDSPPMRSEIAPQICRLTKAVPSSTDSIIAPTELAMPRSLQKATRCPCGIAIGTQQGPRPRTSWRTPDWAASRARAPVAGAAASHGAGSISSGGSRKNHSASGTIEHAFDQRVPQHGLAPAERGDGALEHRRPHRAGEIGAARDQRQRRAAPAVEPAADIDVERRVDAAEPDQADEQPVPDPQRPGQAQGRDRQARPRSSARRRPPSSACRCGRRSGPSGCRRGRSRARPARWQGGDRARAVHFGGDVLERHRGDPVGAEGHHHGDQRHRGDDPGRSGLDRAGRGLQHQGGSGAPALQAARDLTSHPAPAQGPCCIAPKCAPAGARRNFLAVRASPVKRTDVELSGVIRFRPVPLCPI